MSTTGVEDIQTALRDMSNGKSGGALGTVPELKGNGLCFGVALVDLLGDVWTQLHAPRDWRL